MKVAAAMSREVLALAPDTSLSAAARLFATRHITGAPVIDHTGQVLGVVSQTDLVDPDRSRSEASGHSGYYRVSEGQTDAVGEAVGSEDGMVADVMSANVLSIGPAAPLCEAIHSMVAEGVHRLLVADEGRLVGIISSMDVLRVLSDHCEVHPDLRLGRAKG